MRSDQRTDPLAWIWWTVVGATVAVGVVGLLTVGVLFLVIAGAMAAVGARWSRTRGRGVAAILVGAAAAPLLLAWLNRGGPGVVCRSEGTVTSCSEQWSPWPFVIVAILLVVAGCALASGLRPSRRR